MVTINLLDGTRDPAHGRAIIPALNELSKYVPGGVVTTPAAGSVDIPGYRLAKMLESYAYNQANGKVEFHRLLKPLTDEFHKLGMTRRSTALVLIEEDLYTDGLNWCFGGMTFDPEGRKYLAISTARLQTPYVLSHVATHELGHRFGAAPQGRRNTEESLGPHCTNICVMQQRTSVDGMNALARQLASRENKFCYDCIADLRNYR